MGGFTAKAHPLMADPETPTAQLRRTLSFPLVCFYGLGTILGAGIYVLVGEVAGIALLWAPIAFLVAGVLAAFTALSYAELSSRIPQSAGEAAYLLEAFRLKLLAGCAGWGVVITGIVSAATVTLGFVGYLRVFIDLPQTPVIIVSLLIMGGLAIWGIGQSVVAASVVTALEISGLVLVIALAGHHLSEIPEHGWNLLPSFSLSAWGPIWLGAYLAFFAFIGFEDMVNLAEEVKEPHRTLPKAIVVCLLVSTAFYVLIALIAILALPPEQLKGEAAPLAAILAERGPWARSLISLISMVAVINGALIQIIMASRVVYGMAKTGMAPRPFAAVSPHTQTPILATAAATAVITLLAVGFPLVSLAKATSGVTLFVFALVNASLWRLKTRPSAASSDDHVTYPLWVPVTGCLLSSIALLTSLLHGMG